MVLTFKNISCRFTRPQLTYLKQDYVNTKYISFENENFVCEQKFIRPFFVIFSTLQYIIEVHLTCSYKSNPRQPNFHMGPNNKLKLLFCVSFCFSLRLLKVKSMQKLCLVLIP